MFLRSATTIAVLTALGARAALDPSGPGLRFNWTLSTVDAVVRLGPYPDVGWVQTTSGAFPKQVVVPDKGAVSVKVAFMGDGFAVHGHSGAAWTQADAGHRPKLYVTGDAGFPTAGEQLDAPESEGTAVSRAFPRFKDYDADLYLGEGDWEVDGVTIMTGLETNATSLDDVPTRVEPLVVNGTANPYFNLTGRWEVTPADDTLPTRLTCYDDAVLTCPVPPNTAYVVLNGTRGPASRDFDIMFSTPEDPNNGHAIVWTKYPNNTEALLYMTPLDPKLQHTMTFDCVEMNAIGENALTNLVFYFSNGTVAGNDTSAGGNGSASGSGSGSAGDSSATATATSAKMIGAAVVAAVAAITLI